MTSAALPVAKSECNCTCTYANGNVDCNSCSNMCYCEIPQQDPGGPPIELECKSIEIIFDEMRAKAGEAAKAGAKAAAPPPMIVARVPDVNDPSQWRTVVLTAIRAVTSIELRSIGWQLFFLRGGTGTAAPVVTPATLPVGSFDALDTALAATVILPEDSGFEQYWVTVMDRFGWALLQTSGWTVIFLKDPSP